MSVGGGGHKLANALLADIRQDENGIELAERPADPLTAGWTPRIRPRSSAHNGTVAADELNTRSVLTLEALLNETQRSRCPLVVGADDDDDARKLPKPQPLSLLHPAERISTDSFERRRSIYESTPNASRKTSRSNKSAFDDSLDAILADIKARESEAQTSGERTASLNGDGDDDERSISNFSNNVVERPGIDFELVWLDFTYSIGGNSNCLTRAVDTLLMQNIEPRTILKGVTGGVRSGQMVALMGPSGAGKTCLLECISGMRREGIGGQMRLRGRKRAELVIVPQYDVFMPQFTVEETITYGSKMKNARTADHKAITDKAIKQLGLEVCRSNNIMQCSGGQRKRVAIAQELVSRPNVLVLDEPTSGLDSSCCYQTMHVLRDVLDESAHTDQPMAIVMTIHQPSAKVFRLFDKVYLLGKTGKFAYTGPPDELLPTIRQVSGLECPQYSNPSDYMIELVAYDYGEEPVERLIEFEERKALQFKLDWERRVRQHMRRKSVALEAAAVAAAAAAATTTIVSQNGHAAGSKIKHALPQISLASGASDASNPKQQTALCESVPLRKATDASNRKHPFFWHLYLHIIRSFQQSARDQTLNNMRILIHIGFASLLVMLFGKGSGQARGCPPVLGLPSEITDPNEENMIDLSDNIGYLFMCMMMITYVSLMSTVLTFPTDIRTVSRDYNNGWYKSSTYFLGRTLADLPFITCYPLCFCIITWYIADQPTDHAWRFFSFLALLMMNAMNSQSLGLIYGAVFVNSITAATFLGPVTTIPWYLFTGFTKRVHRLAEPFKSLSRVLFTRHVFEGLLSTAYGHERCNCSQFLERYHELRYEEAVRLGQLLSAETLSSLDYYDGLDVVVPPELASANLSSPWYERTFDAATNVFAAEEGEQFTLAHLMERNNKASSLFSFGLDFEPTCPADYKTYIVQDFHLSDETLEESFVKVSLILLILRVLTYIIVAWKLRTRTSA